ncbi:MAG: carbohydrate ABC transporter permease [Caldilineaceae bacterium]|nr:carbohydrate ABC transporter permease [Caldilineaceae bacterium]
MSQSTEARTSIAQRYSRTGLAGAARTALLYVTAIGMCLMAIFPIYWMIVSTIQPSSYSTRYPPPLWPQAVDLTPLVQVLTALPIVQWILNTTLLAALTVLIVLSLTVLGAFTLSALRWRGRSGFGLFLLMTQMLPEALIVIPIFVIFRDLGLRENLVGLSLIDAAFVLPIGIWILKNIFDTIPLEIYDAALVDGCTPVGVLWRIILPLSKPGLVAVGVVAFFHAWNEFLFASTMITRDAIRPASVGLASLISMLDTPIERVLAGGLIFALFPVIFYLTMQRHIVAGLTAGAVKG